MPAHERTKESVHAQEQDMMDTEQPGVGPLALAGAHIDEPALPTLLQAFFVLCEAIAGALEDDMPAWTHVQEIQAWAVNAGDDAAGRLQMVQAWRHAVQVLEGILGQPLTLR